MELHEYTRLDGVGLAELIRSGDVRADEVEKVAREALHRADEVVNGLTGPMFEPALEHAADGPFAGVPFLIKDVPMAAGVHFAVGSRAVPPFVVAEHDTELMRRFRAAGLVTLGSTTMCEFGLSFSTEPLLSGPTRNPYDPERGVGGSSGGSAALVAAGAVPFAHANDGAGSIRVPASCCGLVGLKPSRGRVPAGPDTGEAAFGLAYEFAVTRTVRDAAHLLDAVHGPAAGDKYTAPPPAVPYARLGAEPAGLRVALTTEAWSGVAVDPEVAAATVRAGQLLERLGHHVTAASPAVDWESVLEGVRGEAVANVAPFLLAPRGPDPAALEAVSRRAIEETRSMSALDLVRAFAAHNRVSRSVGRFLDDFDLLVTPTIGQLPAPHGTLDYDNPEHTLDSWLRRLFEYGPFTAVFNIAGQPAVSLPLGRSATGLPIGVQIVAGYGREDLLLRIAAALEPEFATKPIELIGK